MRLNWMDVFRCQVPFIEAFFNSMKNWLSLFWNQAVQIRFQNHKVAADEQQTQKSWLHFPF